jgi:two-component system response regulator HydG
MVLTKDNIIGSDVLPFERPVGASPQPQTAPLGDLRQLERNHLNAVLEKCGWNKYLAAKTLGVSRSTLYSKIKRFGLENPREKRA